MRRYQDILTIPGALRFSAAGLLARSGGAMMGIGLVLMVSAIYHSYGLAGALVAANSTAWAVGTAVLSGLVDRFGQRRVMYPAAIISAGMLTITVLFALWELPAWTLFAPAILSGATGGSPGALVRARWNFILDDPEQLHTAFSLEATLDEVTYVIGPVAATALATTVHPVAGLVAPIVLALLGAQLFYSQRSTEPPVPPRSTARPRPRIALMIPGVAAVVAVSLLIGAVFGAVDVSVVAASTEWGARAASGAVLGVFSVASGLAGFYYGSRNWKSTLVNRYLIGVIAFFVTTLALLLSNNVVLLSILGFVLGATVAPTLINANSVVSQLVPDQRLTEGLAWVGTGIGIGASVGSSIAGASIDQFGHVAGFATVASFGTATVILALASSRSLRVDLDHVSDTALA